MTTTTNQVMLETLPKVNGIDNEEASELDQNSAVLKYLKYLRGTRDTVETTKPCLPPLTIRTAQGKYRDFGGSLTSLRIHDDDARSELQSVTWSDAPRSRDSIRSKLKPWKKSSSKPRAKSVPNPSKGVVPAKPPLVRSKTEYLDHDSFHFPRELCDGPFFQFYTQNPKLRSSMDFRKVRALKMVIGGDFEKRTGISEAEYYDGSNDAIDLAEKAMWVRKRKDGFKPTVIKSSSSHNHRKSVAKLPTIHDERDT